MTDARAFVDQLRSAGLRATIDDRAGTLNYKVREAEVHKVPYMAVIGAREAQAATVAVRHRGAGRKQEVMNRAELVARLQGEVTSKQLP
jgi:threonyl-tRNA synthetase